nr:MAG TPA: hypothetical protein [Caudoviricetes sp.]
MKDTRYMQSTYIMLCKKYNTKSKICQDRKENERCVN